MCSRQQQQQHHPYFSGIPSWISLPKGESTSSSNKVITLALATQETPYIYRHETLQRSVVNFYLENPRRLKKFSALVSRFITPGNNNSKAYINLLRSDTLAPIASLEVTKEELHVVETKEIINLPVTPVILEITAHVDDPTTNIQIHNISFHV